VTVPGVSAREAHVDAERRARTRRGSRWPRSDRASAWGLIAADATAGSRRNCSCCGGRSTRHKFGLRAGRGPPRRSPRTAGVAGSVGWWSGPPRRADRHPAGACRGRRAGRAVIGSQARRPGRLLPAGGRLRRGPYRADDRGRRRVPRTAPAPSPTAASWCSATSPATAGTCLGPGLSGAGALRARGSGR